jgi:hypothetical protein
MTRDVVCKAAVLPVFDRKQVACSAVLNRLLRAPAGHHVGDQPSCGRVLPPELVGRRLSLRMPVARYSLRLTTDSAFCEYKYLGITNAFGHGSKTEVVNTITNVRSLAQLL